VSIADHVEGWLFAKIEFFSGLRGGRREQHQAGEENRGQSLAELSHRVFSRKFSRIPNRIPGRNAGLVGSAGLEPATSCL
jgi:hypothetical protein